ncbi:MAG: EamA family transporter, partial [Desulfobacterales bacterium]
MKNQPLAMVLGLGTVLMWSTVATAFKLTLRELTPVQMLFVACAASVAVLTAILLVQRRLSLVFSMSRRQYLQSMGMGLINPCLY